MTFLHGAACAVFCFGPPLAVYKATNLWGYDLMFSHLEPSYSEDGLTSDHSGTRWLLSLASIFYLLNLFAKSLLVASFLPATCENSSICSVAVDIITVVMEINSIRYLLSHKTSLSYSAETRLLCIGLGWSVGHTICANGNLLLRGLSLLFTFRAAFLHIVLPVIVFAAVGSVAFRWVDIYYALQASLSPLCYLSVTALTFIASRRRMPRTSQIGLLLLAAMVVPWTLAQKHALGLIEPPKRFLADEITPLCWLALALHASLAASAGIATYISFKAGQRQVQAQKLE